MELLSSQVTCWMCVVTCWCPPGMFHDRLDTIIGVWVLYVGVLGSNPRPTTWDLGLS